jgi:nucleoid-associated protein YgaU
MAAIAAALRAVAPAPGAAAAALSAPQHLVDTSGPDALVLALAALLAWAAWAWGAIGLVLTAAAALPGVVGSASSAVLHVVVPAGLRRAAGMALGAGVALGGPLGTGVALAAPPAPSVAATASATGTAVPDWPSSTQEGPAPAGPTAVPAATPTPGPHVVVTGECLWRIAGDQLRSADGSPATDAAVATTVHAWWTANAQVIGPDPDLIRPGQVLRPPTQP